MKTPLESASAGAGLPSGRRPSLAEVNSSVVTSRHTFWRRMLAFAGPAYLVSVGYMDPGNWAADLEAGARFGCRLLWVLVLSNIMAILLQTLAARLGIVTKLDLAQVCREAYPRSVNLMLYGFCEIAIAACDLAEVLGAAIGLQLLFHIPLIAGVIITAADTLLVLWLTRYGIRAIEAVIVGLIAAIAACFLFEIWLVKPNALQIAAGMIPRIDNSSLFAATAILGATVMPHNLYLHSALVQTRRIGASEPELRTACKFNFLDSMLALNGALVVNAAILILAASVFFTHGVVVTEIQQAYQLLAPLLGTALASIVFAVALLCSGQSSTLTGTLAGQIVMEGFLSFRMRPWLRRFLTRSLAVVPAVICIWISGEGAAFQLLLWSQVVLSLQLPFAIIPLIHFTSDRVRMGPFANGPWLKVSAWVITSLIVALNVQLAATTIAGLFSTHSIPWYASGLLFAALTGIGGLLVWITFAPLSQRGARSIQLPEVDHGPVEILHYDRILVTLDHSPFDRRAIAHAAALARQHNAEIVLLHIEEGVTSQIYGAQASTTEVEQGEKYFDNIIEGLSEQGIRASAIVRHGPGTREAIVNAARELQPDLIVMAAHGHRGIKDIIFGNTINAIRHQLATPLLIVRESPKAGGTS